MKIKIFAILGLAMILSVGACRKDATNANVNTNVTVSTPTPIVKTTESATTDPNLKSKIEAALKAKGFTDVTVDTSTPKMTLRGTVAKGKLADVMSTAMEANGGKPIDNQVTEK